MNSESQRTWEPKFLLADAADSITLAAKNSFPNMLRLPGWAHVKRAFSFRLTHIKKKPLEIGIKEDIYKMKEQLFLKVKIRKK